MTLSPLLADYHQIVLELELELELVLNEMVLVLLLGSPRGSSSSTKTQSIQAFASKREVVISERYRLVHLFLHSERYIL
jgi:hypothetical protein